MMYAMCQSNNIRLAVEQQDYYVRHIVPILGRKRTIDLSNLQIVLSIALDDANGSIKPRKTRQRIRYLFADRILYLDNNSFVIVTSQCDTSASKLSSSDLAERASHRIPNTERCLVIHRFGGALAPRPLPFDLEKILAGASQQDR